MKKLNLLLAAGLMAFGLSATAAPPDHQVQPRGG